MGPQMDKKSEKPELPMQQRPAFDWKLIFWLTLLILIFFYFFNTFRAPRSVNLPYSEFKKEVEKGSVSEIKIKGQKITGTFSDVYNEVSESGEDTTEFREFSTVKPGIDDPRLMEILEANEVTVNAETEGSPWGKILLFLILPWILIIVLFSVARNKMSKQMGTMGGLFNVGKSRAKKFMKSRSDVSFDDVAGLDNAKRDLREIIEYLKEPDRFSQLGASIPKGVLLIGPPGTGKTLLARATAGEADCSFFSISGSEFIEMFVGVGASRVRDMFDNAKKEAPSIIFIDEIDSVGRARGTGLGGGHDEREQTLNQILSEMDGFSPQESVIVMAATNRPDVLDPALTRPGRFDRQITLDLPQKNARHKILKIHTKAVPLADDVDLENIAARIVGFSGADIRNLVNEAALLAGRKEKSEVDSDDFFEARDKIVLGHEREDMMNDREKKVIAYHEAGHTLLAKLLPGADPVEKVSIIPRGRALGATEQLPEEDRHNLSRKYLLDRITIMLGGRSAEQLVFGQMTTGSGDDLKRVTKIARRMVSQWGMSDRLGAVTFNFGEDHVFLGQELTQQKDFSEATARIIDEEVQKLVNNQEKKAISLLKENREKLEKLTDSLLEHETLEKEEIDDILGFKK
jgi:cell division protease FtsH